MGGALPECRPGRRRGAPDLAAVDEGSQDPRAVAETVARRSYGKLVALLVRRGGDIAGAEDALADAFAAALADWPARGVPRNPEAWLLTAARRKQIDASRRVRTADVAAGVVRFSIEQLAAARDESAEPDERLSLMFACAHPAIDPAVRAPLILQTILGFDAATIGSAFLVSPSTMGQRLVRAKRKIREAGIPFRLPEPSELAERLEGVLDAIYAAFAEGWSDAGGTDSRRRSLADDAIWLGRLVASQLPAEPEALGLVALMLYAQSRRDARCDAEGRYVPLTEQDPTAWDGAMLDEAEALLSHASTLPGTGRYQLEAAVQSAHAVRRLGVGTDWRAIVAIYDALLAATASPVVAVNRAVALAESRGARAGLEALAPWADDPRLSSYQPFWAARADLLARDGDAAAADEAYARAIGLETDPVVRGFLERRRRAVAGSRRI